MTLASPNRHKLFDAAVDLFSHKGCEGVSIRELCRAVGIKESSFYNHFPGKDELLAEILEDLRQRFRQSLPAGDVLDALLEMRQPLDFFENGAQRFVDMLSDPLMRRLNRILYMEQYRNPIAREIILEDVLRRPLRFMEAAMEKMIHLGWLRPLDPRQLAFEYYMPMYSLFLQSLLLECAGEGPLLWTAQFTEHVRMFTELVKV